MKFRWKVSEISHDGSCRVSTHSTGVSRRTFYGGEIIMLWWVQYFLWVAKNTPFKKSIRHSKKYAPSKKFFRSTFFFSPHPTLSWKKSFHCKEKKLPPKKKVFTTPQWQKLIVEKKRVGAKKREGSDCRHIMYINTKFPWNSYEKSVKFHMVVFIECRHISPGVLGRTFYGSEIIML